MSGRMQLVVAPPPAKKKAVNIGCRWVPGQVERRKPDGSYEMVNSRVEAVSERRVQRALIGNGNGWFA